jgi:hypothetical protein
MWPGLARGDGSVNPPGAKLGACAEEQLPTLWFLALAENSHY